MSVSSKKRKKCLETYPDSCNAIAISEDGVLVDPRDACKCEGYGEAVGPFAFVRKRIQRGSKFWINLVSLAFFFLLSYVYAINASAVTTLSLETCLLAYAGTVLFLTGLQVTLAYVLARAMGYEIDPAVVAVPSPLPSFLPLFDVKEEACSKSDYAKTLSISLLVAVLVAALLGHAFQWVMGYPKTKLELIYFSPKALADVAGVYGPVAAGAAAFMMSALFQLTLYPFSPSWSLAGFSNAMFPLLVGLSLSVNVKGLGVVLSGYVLVSALLSIFVRERPAWKDPFGEPRALETAALLITLLLVALVG